MPKRFTVTFYKNTGDQREPSLPEAEFPVEASTKSEALRTALEMWRCGNQGDTWDSVSVRAPYGS